MKNDEMTWLEAKEGRKLFLSTPNLAPTDSMFSPAGKCCPTKLYTEERTKSSAKYLPVKYDLDYVLDFYKERVTKQLSSENQLVLLEAITALYTKDTCSKQGDFTEYLETLLEADKLQLCKDLAKSLGKRVIPAHK